MREVVLDTETTGLDVLAGHRIVEIGCVELINHVQTGESWQAYLNPQRENEREAFNVHGLSDSFLSKQPLFHQRMDDFLEFLQDSRLVIHNAEFDLKFINNELRMEGADPISGERVVDSLHLARQIYPGQANSLDALMKRLGVDASERTHHGALLDAKLLAEVYLELMGGRQSGLAFAAETQGAEYINAGDATPREAHEARPHDATEEEIAHHEAFLDQLDDPIWRRSSG
ncbi:MAG: DNA polymerase III subunit epsilon [Rhodospirillaceae bacterium]|nr:DNA polymerase III subunit epsilon [Rhodospirillaceae bacterium]MBN33924.1 DNA polymerase III subunit epsilon [Rhodospirillaceae bacterium]